MVTIPFDNTYARLPGHFYTRQKAAQVPAPELIRVNEKLATSLAIDPQWLRSEEGIEVLAGNVTPAGAEPLAQAYAGHQFGGFVPQLGDGRALLLGEIVHIGGSRKDWQLKGSGRTPFSRGGDGKSALGPVLREYIMSEAMHALGVPTTRALAAVSSGEKVIRQEGALDGAVFSRIASSHLRVGTFQYFAAQRDTESVRRLADYAIARHYPGCLATSNQPATAAPYLAFLQAVMQAQAKLIAHWMSLGFIHGVMNTDNCSISGETIDYGPCAMMDAFHPQCVFSSIDVNGRYNWGNQPNIGLWNLTRLAETLLPLIHDDRETAAELAEVELSGFSSYFSQQYMSRFKAKFGLAGDPCPENDSVIQDGLSLIANQAVDFTVFFRQLTRVGLAGEQAEATLENLFKDKTSYRSWFSSWQKAHLAAKGSGSTNDQPVLSMSHSNPILIPRNHRIEQAIQAAYAGDFSPFHQLVDALQSPYLEQEKWADLELPPQADEIVHETFCGT